MTQYDEVKELVRSCPGITRPMISKHLPRITHEHEILTKLIESGDGYRERVQGSDKYGNPTETWGYYLN